LTGTYPDTWLLANKPVGRIGVKTMAIFRRRWLVVIWVLIGIAVAWEKTYITLALLKLILSALLAIILWPLVLLGISFHFH
jgi:hypothetical protein